MDNKMKKYLEILKIELEDLIYDIEFNEENMKRRFDEHEITEYVFLENTSLLKREVLGLENVSKAVEKAKAESENVNELRAYIENYFINEMKAAGLPGAVRVLVERKLEKIATYMELED